MKSHIDFFPKNVGDYSEEQGERFHQDIKEIERRYQGRWDVNMMADYCWMICRDEVNENQQNAGFFQRKHVIDCFLSLPGPINIPATVSTVPSTPGPVESTEESGTGRIKRQRLMAKFTNKKNTAE